MSLYDAFRALLSKPIFSGTLHAPAGVLGCLVTFLEEMEQNGGRTSKRYRFYYGDLETGRTRGPAAEDYVATGWIDAIDPAAALIPCFTVLRDVRSVTGHVLYWEGIVKIEGTNPKTVFYEHPLFHTKPTCPPSQPTAARIHRKVVLRRVPNNEHQRANTTGTEPGSG